MGEKWQAQTINVLSGFGNHHDLVDVAYQ